VTTINEILNAWYTSNDEVVRFGRALMEGGTFDALRPNRTDQYTMADNLLDYFNKPYHWNAEHAWWVANDWPDDAESWERGHDSSWEISE